MDQMERNIKSMVDSVDVPSAKLEETVNRSLQIAKKQNNRAFNRRQNIFASIASIFILAIGALLFTSFYQNEVGKQSDVLEKSIIYQVGDDALKRMVEEGKVNNISLVAEDQGIRVFFEEAYLDNNQMAVSYRIDGLDLSRGDIETSIKWDYFINGDLIGHHTFGGLVKSDLFYKGGIFPLHYDTSIFPSESEIKIQITHIDDIEGNWTFQFPIVKNDEHIVKNINLTKKDLFGNEFTINQAELSPTRLLVDATTKFNFTRNLFSGLSQHRFVVVAIGEDDEMHLERVVSSGSDFRDEIVKHNIPYNEAMVIPRTINIYKYKIIPYYVQYNGKQVPSYSGEAYKWDEITAPFETGSVLQLDSMIKVAKIEENKNSTVIYYEMEEEFPIFPIIVNNDKTIELEAKSYKIENDYIKVTYPKVNSKDSVHLLMYDGTYNFYKDLAIEITLK
ncbi:DUF4179 domain-containing protein [Sutcliffiella sp. NC1]|uniref:DUF4179 domain-containing protein n=1 Tax=Sutcliffiella sp. NC1 TaxID=3004096 RepID=UPI0022DE5188|nr:DUF4179 domain-containing protein [Sutcliffiella sp. NC1]WBL15858.1 DUF4179 domain-containing protein [Sutcliffiella sp. NC1]